MKVCSLFRPHHGFGLCFVSARKAPITGVRERGSENSNNNRKEIEQSHRPPHPPPLIAPGSIPTPTAVTLPPPLHPISNPNLESELHQIPGKGLHLGGIPRIPFPGTAPPSLPQHSSHNSSHHQSVSTPQSHHRLSSTPPHQSVPSHHLSSTPSHTLASTPPQVIPPHPAPHPVTPPHAQVIHHHPSTPPHLAHQPPASHYTSSQNSHQRTNSLSASSAVQPAKIQKEQVSSAPAFVRPFEDSFPQQHNTNKRTPVIPPVTTSTFTLPAKDRSVSEVSQIVGTSEPTVISSVITKNHHVQQVHSVVPSTSSIPTSVCVTVNNSSIKQTSVREESRTAYMLPKDNGNLTVSSSDCTTQKTCSLRGSSGQPLDVSVTHQVGSLKPSVDLHQQPGPPAVNSLISQSPPSSHQFQQMQQTFPIVQQNQEPIPFLPSAGTSPQQPILQVPHPPAVLIVPDASKVLAAAKDNSGTMSVWDYHYCSKSITNQRVSILWD